MIRTLRPLFSFLACGLIALLPALARAESKVAAAEPVLLTSAGQSADVQIVKALLDRAKIALKIAPLAQPADLAGSKSVVVAVGGSGKGLGAAGIDAEKEQARIKALLGKAKELKLPVIGLHIGGQAKRGDLSDVLYSLVAAQATCLLIVKDGDQDGFLTKTAAGYKVPVQAVEKITGISGPLKEIFGKP